MPHLHALTVRQPYADLIASGRKTLEIRPRRTTYRGPVLICAASVPRDAQRAGLALAVVELYGCRRYTPTREDLERSGGVPFVASWAWELRLLYALAKPEHVSGRHGIWRLPAELWPDELRDARAKTLGLMCCCQVEA